MLAQLRMLAHDQGRVIERDGLMILGLGTAAVLSARGRPDDPIGLRRRGSSPRHQLRDIPATGQSASAPTPDSDHQAAAPVPLAIGALRFDRRADGELVVPELTVIANGWRSGHRGVVVGSPARVAELLGEPSDRRQSRRCPPGPGSASRRPTTSAWHRRGRTRTS